MGPRLLPVAEDHIAAALAVGTVVTAEHLGGAEVHRVRGVDIDLDRGLLLRVGNKIDDFLCVHIVLLTLQRGFSANHIRRQAARQQPRHVQRTIDENLAAGGPVGDLKLFIRSKEMDGVGPGHGAAPQGVDPHLPGIPAAAVALPAIDRLEGMGGVQSLQQQLGRTAGGVGLLIMMGLRDLNVKIRPQHAGHRLQSPDEHRNAQ